MSTLQDEVKRLIFKFKHLLAIADSEVHYQKQTIHGLKTARISTVARYKDYCKAHGIEVDSTREDYLTELVLHHRDIIAKTKPYRKALHNLLGMLRGRTCNWKVGSSAVIREMKSLISMHASKAYSVMLDTFCDVWCYSSEVSISDLCNDSDKQMDALQKVQDRLTGQIVRLSSRLSFAEKLKAERNSQIVRMLREISAQHKELDELRESQRVVANAVEKLQKGK